MHPQLARAAAIASEHVENHDERPISREPDAESLRRALRRELTEDGVDPEVVIDDLARDMREGILDTPSGRFFGWVIGGTLPVALAADWMTSAWDQNAAASGCSPASAVVEEIAGEWLLSLLGLPASCSFAFVTGCQMAHVTALSAARHRVLADRGWSVETQGLAGSPPIRVLVGEHHETLLRALRQIGLGTDAVVQVGQNVDGTIDTQALARVLAADAAAPTIVCLAAGDLNRGAFDDFATACDLAHEHGAWVHVDGAFGLWAGASPRFRHLVEGVDKADSWATDAHKWLNVPYDSGIAFVADPEAHTRSMAMPAAYAVDVGGVRDQFEWGPEWSRRARANPIYAALRALGRRGVADLVERCCDHATALVDALDAFDGVEIVHRPIINQALVRFLARDGDHDARTEDVIRRVNATGEAWFGPTTYRGMRVMRISVSSHRTTAEDIERAAAAIEGVLRA